MRRARHPGPVITSDVIVGFPGETTEEFEDTVRVLEEVRFDALFTFLYSPRSGTAAAKLPDPLPPEEKQQPFHTLVALQNTISAEKHRAYVGRTLRVLVDGTAGDQSGVLNARTPGGRLVRLSGDPALVGSFAQVTITGRTPWALFGELAQKSGAADG